MQQMLPSELIRLIAGYHRAVFAAIRRTCSEFRHIRGGQWPISATMETDRISRRSLALRPDTYVVPIECATFVLYVDGKFAASETESIKFTPRLVRELYLCGREHKFVYDKYNYYTKCNIKLMRQNEYFTYMATLIIMMDEGTDIEKLADYAPVYGPGDNFTSADIRVFVRAGIDVVAKKMNLDFCDYMMGTKKLHFNAVRATNDGYEYTDRLYGEYKSPVQVPLWATQLCRVTGSNISNCIAAASVAGTENVSVIEVTNNIVHLKKPLKNGLGAMCNTGRLISQPGKYNVTHEWNENVGCHKLLSAQLIQ